jgi:hypothetical protein
MQCCLSLLGQKRMTDLLCNSVEAKTLACGRNKLLDHWWHAWSTSLNVDLWASLSGSLGISVTFVTVRCIVYAPRPRASFGCETVREHVEFQSLSVTCDNDCKFTFAFVCQVEETVESAAVCFVTRERQDSCRMDSEGVFRWLWSVCKVFVALFVVIW